MFEKYLFPIIYNFQCIGNGVLIGKYFFTAAHVIYEGAGNCMVEISGKVFQLREDNALALVAEQNEEKQLLYDFAIYEIDCLHSPFQLSQETLEAKSFLYSYSVKTLYNSSTNEVKRLQLLTNTGKVSNEKIGNILICDLSDKLSGGQSGSLPTICNSASIDTLCGYVWPSEASGSTMRKRRQRVREALPELVALGWTVTEFAAGKYDITRPKAAG